MSQNFNLPICTGDIEIEVPVGVTGNIVFHLEGEDLICPVRNGVIKVDEKAAAHFLAGNNGRPLPGYRKSVTEMKDPGTPDAKGSQGGGAPTDIPSIDQVKAFLKERGIAFHPATGAPKLQALYAAEMAKPASEELKPGTPEPASLTVEALATITLEGLNGALPGTEDPELLKQMIAAEVSGESREEFITALEQRLTELGA